MNNEIMVYFSQIWPLLTDGILVGTELLFVIRLYIVERRFEESLVAFEKECFKKKVELNFHPLSEEKWFLADGCEHKCVTSSQRHRLGRLRKFARFLVVTALGIGALFGAGALWAATSTGSLTVSAIVLSRCFIHFPSFSGKVESECTDGVSFTKETSEKSTNMVIVTPGAPAETTSTPAASQGVTTVTLTY